MKTHFLFILLPVLLSSLSDLSAQQKHFQGQWTKVGTTYAFEFDLYLKPAGGNNVEGHFHWKAVRFDEKSSASKRYYKDKLGTTAKEFVKGTYNPRTREYFLEGYRKEDPHQIISTDSYRLKIDEKGNIGGDSNAHGSWKGRINGKPAGLDPV